MRVLIVFNHEPYDGTDVTWNGLRLAGKLRENGQEVRIFLMNDSVDMARDVLKNRRATIRTSSRCSRTSSSRA